MAATLRAGNACDFLLDVGRPADIAVVDGSRNYTYAEMRRAAARLAGELVRLGVEPGASIAILATNSFFWVASYLAALKLGVAVPLSDRNAAADLVAQAEWVGCSAVLMDRRTQRRLGGGFGSIPVLTDAALDEEGPTYWPETPTDAESNAALMFTSGTTSQPKAVQVTHANLRANTESIVDYLRLTRSDRMLVILPFHYCFGASLLHTHLAVGGSVVLCNSFTFPQTAVDLIRKESCTGFAGVPSSFSLLLRASSYAATPLPSLRLVQQAGGRLAPPQIRELAAAQPQSELFVMYGQTEATARLSYLPPAMLEAKLGSIGKGIPGVQLQVLDEAGQPVPPGVQGEIWARGANISPGYFRDPEATARKFPGGDLRTGDLAVVDEDGYLFIVGRSEDFIKTWGHRVSPQQVEEAALAHPEVAEAAAVGLPDAQAGEAVALAVVPATAGGVDADELLAFLRGVLPKHMVPASIHLVEALPLNANGKVSRPDLRGLLESQGPR